MIQQGRVFRLETRAGAEPAWAYRGTGSAVAARGACSEVASCARRTARAALERALEKLRREGGIGRTVTLAEFVDEYLAQHDASPVTLNTP
jgi:hypothetical protein